MESDLRKDIEDIEKGFDGQHAIQSRADAMRRHLNDGHNQRAQEYADEIFFLQEARARHRQRLICAKDCEFDKPFSGWLLPLDVWAEILIGGAYLVTRNTHCDDLNEARAYVHKISKGLAIEPVMNPCAPRITAIAAE